MSRSGGSFLGMYNNDKIFIIFLFDEEEVFCISWVEVGDLDFSRGGEGVLNLVGF